MYCTGKSFCRSKFHILTWTIHFYREKCLRLVGEVTKRGAVCWRRSLYFHKEKRFILIKLILQNSPPPSQTYFHFPTQYQVLQAATPRITGSRISFQCYPVRWSQVLAILLPADSGCWRANNRILTLTGSPAFTRMSLLGPRALSRSSLGASVDENVQLSYTQLDTLQMGLTCPWLADVSRPTFQWFCLDWFWDITRLRLSAIIHSCHPVLILLLRLNLVVCELRLLKEQDRIQSQPWPHTSCSCWLSYKEQLALAMAGSPWPELYWVLSSVHSWDLSFQCYSHVVGHHHPSWVDPKQPWWSLCHCPQPWAGLAYWDGLDKNKNHVWMVELSPETPPNISTELPGVGHSPNGFLALVALSVSSGSLCPCLFSALTLNLYSSPSLSLGTVASKASGPRLVTGCHMPSLGFIFSRA